MICFRTIRQFIHEVHHTAQDISQLKAAVARQTAAVNSAVVLIEELSQRIRDGVADPAELKAVSDELNVVAQTLETAVSTGDPDDQP